MASPVSEHSVKPSPPAWLARGVVASLSAILLALLLYAVVRRIGYPFGLEWMEGAMLDHVARIAQGRTVYVPPTLAFVPFIYPPVFYLAAAAVAHITGIGFESLRLVSTLATIANLCWVFAFVTRETKRPVAGLAAAGFLAGTYPLSGFWFDIGRVDSLLLCLVLLALYLVRFGSKWTGAVGGAALVTLAFFTKQVALVMVVPLAVYLFRVDRRRALGFLVSTALMVLGLSVLVDSFHAGWFGYYTHRVVGGHPLAWDGWVAFVRGDLLMACGLALGLSLFFWLWGAPRARPNARLFYGSSLAGLLLMALMGRVHTGGWVNVLMPAHAGVAIVFGLGLGASQGASEGGRSPRVGMLGALLAVLQLTALLYDPRPAVPTARDRAAGNAWLAKVQSVPGPVWTTHRGYLPTLAGKRSHAHMMALLDVMRSSADFGGAKARLSAEVQAALSSQRFDLVLMDNHDFWFLPTLERHYRRDIDPWIADPDAFWPPSGARIRPEIGYVPAKP